MSKSNNLEEEKRTPQRKKTPFSVPIVGTTIGNPKPPTSKLGTRNTKPQKILTCGLIIFYFFFEDAIRYAPNANVQMIIG